MISEDENQTFKLLSYLFQLTKIIIINYICTSTP
jgi:hypothetical protein